MVKKNNIIIDLVKYQGTIILFTFIFIIVFNIIYAYSTKFEKIITIDEKYAYGSKSSSGFHTISDKENNIYIIKNSIYYLHWESTELFYSLDENKKYKVEGYGVRIPFLSMYPNIIKATNI